MQYYGTARLQTPQSVAYSSSGVHLTNVVSPGITRVRVVCTTDAFVLPIDPGGADATTSTGHFWPAGLVEYLTVSPGQKITVIRSTADGTMYVSEAT